MQCAKDGITEKLKKIDIWLVVYYKDNGKCKLWMNELMFYGGYSSYPRTINKLLGRVLVKLCYHAYAIPLSDLKFGIAFKFFMRMNVLYK